jgi:hypothetical protein
LTGKIEILDDYSKQIMGSFAETSEEIEKTGGELRAFWKEQKNAPSILPGAFQNKSGIDLLSHTVTHIVPSAQRGLTTLFGMGRGVTPAIKTPEVNNCNREESRSARDRNLGISSKPSEGFMKEQQALHNLLHRLNKPSEGPFNLDDFS